MTPDEVLSSPPYSRSSLWPDGSYAAHLRGGLDRRAAFMEVVTELTDDHHRQVITQLESYPDGQAALARVEQAWADQGWPAPWKPGVAP